ncbi:MAG: DegT/DnrJ/EryC1/StrS family aminotransferase [Candidatus Omnitrophica bacterium]|nr:DegT/DnrJ/EryC1/StrS family aminotransferase [Candidatus Omnitrophota bacterium]
MRNIPLLDLKAQYQGIKNDVNKAVEAIFNSQSFILGAEVVALEKEIASYCGVKYAVGVASGTDALKISLHAAGVGRGDEVIVPSFTFMATAGAASELGAIPVFVDIDPKTYTIDPSLIEKKITGKTKAIIPVHLYGQCADMDRILEISRNRKVPVIEDCAQAIGATYGGRKAGSFGLAGAISFFPSKNLGAFGDGGMITTQSEEFAGRIKVLRVHGSAVRYVHEELGYNSRLDNLQAAILRIKLRALDTWTKARQENAKFFDSELSKIKGVVVPYLTAKNTHVYHQYVIKVDKARRDGLISYLENSGIEARVYYPIPLHLQKCYRSLGYKKGDLPNSEDSADSTVALPVYSELTMPDKKYIVEKIAEFFRKGV